MDPPSQVVQEIFGWQCHFSPLKTLVKQVAIGFKRVFQWCRTWHVEWKGRRTRSAAAGTELREFGEEAAKLSDQRALSYVTP